MEENYDGGVENIFIRIYFYLAKGLDVLNLFRNLFLAIFALYVTLKLANPFYMVVMLIVSCLILIVIGRYSVLRMAKVIEWLNLRFSTHYGIRSFNYTEKQTELLEEILKELKHVNSSQRSI